MPLIGFGFTSTALDFLETIPHKIRRQVIRKAKALHTEPFPSGCKKLHGVETDEGGTVYRQRSGDYRILYVVKESPPEIVVLDIDNRKDVYKMPKTDSKPADEMRMPAAEFDKMMQKALETPVLEESKAAKKSGRKAAKPAAKRSQP